MNKTLLHIIRFVVLVLVQVLLVNHIRLGGYVHPYVYILFVMLLPINISNWQLLLLGFGLGFCVDMFTGTPGLHAGATTLMAFCRWFREAKSWKTCMSLIWANWAADGFCAMSSSW